MQMMKSEIWRKYLIKFLKELKKSRLLLRLQALGKLATIIESMMDGIITTDNNGKIILINTSAEDMLGGRDDESLSEKMF